jgi:hypothetical protein
MTAYSIMDAVQRESGMRFEELLKLYAKECEYTMHHTGKLLGYKSHSAFVRLCKKYGWDKLFEGNKPIPADREYSPEHSMGSPLAKSIEWEGITDSLIGHARRLGIPRNTVYNRQRKRPDDWAYVLRRVKHNAPRRVVKPAAWNK